jgi:hypothetical protein
MPRALDVPTSDEPVDTRSSYNPSGITIGQTAKYSWQRIKNAYNNVTPGSFDKVSVEPVTFGTSPALQGTANAPASPPPAAAPANTALKMGSPELQAAHKAFGWTSTNPGMIGPATAVNVPAPPTKQGPDTAAINNWLNRTTPTIGSVYTGGKTYASTGDVANDYRTAAIATLRERTAPKEQSQVDRIIAGRPAAGPKVGDTRLSDLAYRGGGPRLRSEVERETALQASAATQEGALQREQMGNYTTMLTTLMNNESASMRDRERAASELQRVAYEQEQENLRQTERSKSAKETAGIAAGPRETAQERAETRKQKSLSDLTKVYTDYAAAVAKEGGTVPSFGEFIKTNPEIATGYGMTVPADASAAAQPQQQPAPQEWVDGNGQRVWGYKTVRNGKEVIVKVAR